MNGTQADMKVQSEKPVPIYPVDVEPAEEPAEDVSEDTAEDIAEDTDDEQYVHHQIRVLQAQVRALQQSVRDMQKNVPRKSQAAAKNRLKDHVGRLAIQNNGDCTLWSVIDIAHAIGMQKMASNLLEQMSRHLWKHGDGTQYPSAQTWKELEAELSRIGCMPVGDDVKKVLVEEAKTVASAKKTKSLLSIYGKSDGRSQSKVMVLKSDVVRCFGMPKHGSSLVKLMQDVDEVTVSFQL